MTTEKIKEYIKQAHENAVDKGFYDCPGCEGLPRSGKQMKIYEKCICNNCNGTGIDPNKNIGELLMLIVSELSEALEAHRCGRFAELENYLIDESIHGFDESSFNYFVNGTFEDEIADVFIRLFDLCGYKNPVLAITIPKKDEVPDNIGQCLISIAHSICHIAMEDMFYSMSLSQLISFCNYHNIDIEKHIEAKMAYNRTRPRKHGKEY